MNRTILVFASISMALLAAGCGHRGPRSPFGPGQVNPLARERLVDLRLIADYDTDKNGILTRAELEAGLKQAFAAADTNGDGHLDADETAAENQRRWQAAGPAASPLIDWNQDGVIDFAEFSTTSRSLFDQLDRDHDGMLSKEEMTPPRAGRAPKERPPGAPRPDGAGQGPGPLLPRAP